VFTAAESSDLWREVGKEDENYGRKGVWGKGSNSNEEQKPT
jgi:hypothetical protein